MQLSLLEDGNSSVIWSVEHSWFSVFLYHWFLWQFISFKKVYRILISSCVCTCTHGSLQDRVFISATFLCHPPSTLLMETVLNFCEKASCLIWPLTRLNFSLLLPLKDFLNIVCSCLGIKELGFSSSSKAKNFWAIYSLSLLFNPFLTSYPFIIFAKCSQIVKNTHS